MVDKYANCRRANRRVSHQEEAEHHSAELAAESRRVGGNIERIAGRYSCWNTDGWDIWASKSIFRIERRAGAVGGAIKRNFDERQRG